MIFIFYLVTYSSCIKLTHKFEWTVWDTYNVLNLTQMLQWMKYTKGCKIFVAPHNCTLHFTSSKDIALIL